ncbi:MAG TPA: MFS transporter [Roseiarcus sp.]|nr:MFS transporter [Roseiarcus sp.]
MSALTPPGKFRMRLHAAVAAMFFAFGIGAGLWGGASGAILIRAGVDAATFGVLLTFYTGAYLIAMSAGGAVGHRFGVDQALSVSAIIFGAALCALLNASSEAWVAIALIVAGFLGGVVDLLMNAEGARIERRLGRPILARLHAAASAGMALGAILGSLIVVGPAPWAAGVLAALGLAGAGVAYHRAARTDRPPSAAVGSIARSGLSFAPALLGLGIVVGVSIAAELAASVWSSLLLREEAPKLAAISGLGAAFFSACQAALRFNVDAIRLRVSDLRIIIASFAIAAAGFALVGVQAGFAASVAGFALIGVGTGPIVPCGFALAARQAAAGPAVGLASASLFSALTRLPAPLATGAIAQALSLSAAFAAFALALVTTAAAVSIIAYLGRAQRGPSKA